MQAFYGIFHRLDESVELLCFTFCWDHAALGFEERKSARHGALGAALGYDDGTLQVRIPAASGPALLAAWVPSVNVSSGFVVGWLPSPVT